MFTPIPTVENNMPNITTNMQLNAGITPVVERLRIKLQKIQTKIVEEDNRLAVPGHHVTAAIAISSAVERMYRDLLNGKHINVSSYDEQYKAEKYQAGMSIYITDEAAGTIASLARLISAEAPHVDTKWRGKISAKKVCSLAIYYVIDTY